MGSVPVDIGIVCPAHDVVSFVEGFFSCLEAQTYQGFRVIVVDDCSSDGSFEALTKCGAALGDRFELLRNERNIGPGPTRNAGLDRLCEEPTEYVTFLDLDDWFEPTYLQDLHDAAVEFGSDITIAGIVRYEDGTNHVLATEMVSYADELFPDSSLVDDFAYINTCLYAKLYRFEEIRGVRFRNMRRSEDTCWLFESLPSLRSVKFTNNALYHYRVGAGTLSSALGEDKYEDMHREFARQLRLFDSGPHAPYREMFECQVYIRSSLGGVTRVAFTDMRRALSLSLGERRWLDSVMPAWRRNRYLALGCGHRSRGLKELAMKVTATMYKANVFVLFIFAYYLVSNVLKREVRA